MGNHLAKLIFCTYLLTACGQSTTTLDNAIIDTTHHAISQTQRIRFIILHYTAVDDTQSLQTLTQGNVSAHYLVSSDGKTIYQLVNDDHIAWHAGQSFFLGRHNLNDTSIGIEMVNAGVFPEYLDFKGFRPYHHYVAYNEHQIEQTAKLIQQLVQKYDIRPSHILSHSDIAPQRKIDVGAKFPWQLLHDSYGLGAWYDEADKQLFMDKGFNGASVQDIKAQFRHYGYDMNDTDEWDKHSRNVIYAFQIHFNPKKATGDMDLETYAILQALNKKYRQSP